MQTTLQNGINIPLGFFRTRFCLGYKNAPEISCEVASSSHEIKSIGIQNHHFISSQRFAHLNIDNVGIFPFSENNSYCLKVVDRLIKRASIIKLKCIDQILNLS